MGIQKPLDERVIDFGSGILKLIHLIPMSMAGRHVADQLMRSGTSIGANYHEARGAESKVDFVHKLQVALKEARESYYWLTLLSRAEMLPPKFYITMASRVLRNSRHTVQRLWSLQKRTPKLHSIF